LKKISGGEPNKFKKGRGSNYSGGKRKGKERLKQNYDGGEVTWDKTSC